MIKIELDTKEYEFLLDAMGLARQEIRKMGTSELRHIRDCSNKVLVTHGKLYRKIAQGWFRHEL